MQFVADFHIHSKYSRATSKDMDVEHLDKWAKIKGIKVLGTGDFTHPLYLKELKENLEPAENGLFKLKSSRIKKRNSNELIADFNLPENDTRFMLTAEISCIYSKNNRTRKIHLLIFAPSFEVVEKINAHLGWIGNIKSDGRPILGLDAKEAVKIVLSVSEDCLVIPAHAWTPHFSVFGSASGFDTLTECFDEYTKYIYAIETGLSCYDENTEVLTDAGWKKFLETKYSDKICTLNPTTSEIEFQKPTKIHSYDYKGKMYRLKTKRVDLLVTPNHKLFYSTCDFRKQPKFSLKEAELLFNKSKRFKKDGVWIGKSPEYFTLPSVKIRHGSPHYLGLRDKKEKWLPIRPWLKFFGFWIAEGWTTEGKNGDYNVCLANKDNLLLFEMKKILEEFGYNVYWDKKTIGTIRVRDYQLFHYLKQFGKCFDKFISPEVKSLSRELLEIFLEYYIKGDGHIYGRSGKGLSATTTSIRLRDDLQEIALKMGISAYYKLHNKKGTPFKSPGHKYKKIYKQRNDSWLIFFIRKNIHIVLPSIIKKNNYIETWVDFKGPVFCVTVPNHVIYIRRNGIPIWCGNSDPAMNWRLSQLDKITLISNSDSHSPSRIGRESNIFDTEVDYFSIADVIKKKDAKKFLSTVEFFPEEGKYHIDGHRDCKISMSPEETQKHKGICPACNKPLTIGVLYRVMQLADRPEGFKPENAIPYKSLVPLDQIIADALDMGVAAKAVKKEYVELINRFGNEFNILLNAEREELQAVSSWEIAEGIMRVREGKLKIEPGYDGEYGVVKIFEDNERDGFSKQNKLF